MIIEPIYKQNQIENESNRPLEMDVDKMQWLIRFQLTLNELMKFLC